MYNWITLLYTWNSHNIVNQLYFHKKILKSKNKTNTSMSDVIITRL